MRGVTKTLSRRVVLSASALALITISPGCAPGSTNTASSGSGLPATVRLLSIRDETGVTAFAGLSAISGAQAAIKEINDSGYLGRTKLVMDRNDAASNAQTAASLAAKGVASKKYAAVLGPILGAESRAVAPIAERAKIPVVFTQSNSDGVLIGEYTFRAAAPFPGYYDVMGDYLRGKNVTRLGVLFDSTTASYVETATKVLPRFEEKFSIQVVASKEVQPTTQDFTASISSIVDNKPDAVAVYLLGTGYSTFMKQLRQTGFNGPVIAANGASNGNLSGAGKDGVGVTWPTAFAASSPEASTQKFLKAFKSSFPDDDPNLYSAEGYDAVWWVARALKKTGDAAPASVRKGLSELAASGFDGAQGRLRFEGNDLRIEPKIVQWDGSREVPVR
ncbi:ABC transporter substrate-binding protein [Streptomyces chartreusis]|uniref:ABC transporter substrate-binding protein n=1 Tax=Streptomyces chartreusis TaxID=1969 RepID=UPI003426BEFD